MPLAHSYPAVSLQTLLPPPFLYSTYMWQQPTPLGTTANQVPRLVVHVYVHRCAYVYVCVHQHIQRTPSFAQAQNIWFLSDPGTATWMFPFLPGPRLCSPTFQAQAFSTDDVYLRWMRRGAVASQTLNESVLNERMSLHGSEPKCICITNTF